MKLKTNRNFKVLLGQITSTINAVKFFVYVFPIQQLPGHNNIVTVKVRLLVELGIL